MTRAGLSVASVLAEAHVKEIYNISKNDYFLNAIRGFSYKITIVNLQYLMDVALNVKSAIHSLG